MCRCASGFCCLCCCCCCPCALLFPELNLLVDQALRKSAAFEPDNMFIITSAPPASVTELIDVHSKSQCLLSFPSCHSLRPCWVMPIATEHWCAADEASVAEAEARHLFQPKPSADSFAPALQAYTEETPQGLFYTQVTYP